MSNSVWDADSFIALAAAMVAAMCLLMAVRCLSNRKLVVGVAWLVGFAVFGFAAYFFAVVTIRLF